MIQADKLILKFFKNTFVLLPLIYFTGALLDSYDVFERDFLYGLPFLFFGIYFLIKDDLNLTLLSSAYFSHAFFDLLYLSLIKDSYMTPYYEIVCIVYDLLVSIYVLRKKRSNLTSFKIFEH